MRIFNLHEIYEANDYIKCNSKLAAIIHRSYHSRRLIHTLKYALHLIF